MKLLFTCLIKQVDMHIYKKPLGGMHIGQKKKKGRQKKNLGKLSALAHRSGEKNSNICIKSERPVPRRL